MVTLIAVVCYTLGNISTPICHEEIVAKKEAPMMACMQMAQPVVADWKEKSKFSGEKWTIAGVACRPGDYLPKDAI
jgi:hypothetical protein